MASEANVIDLQALNLREDEATTEGTLAVRYLVQKLQELMKTQRLAPRFKPCCKANLQGHLTALAKNLWWKRQKNLWW